MAGYRDTSSFDPNAYPQYGKPLRPYNKLQWTGVALVVVGIALDLLYFAGRLGWEHARGVTPTFALLPLMLGVSLVNSRREPLSTETRSPSRRTLALIAIALVAFAVGLALVLYFQGA